MIYKCAILFVIFSASVVAGQDIPKLVEELGHDNYSVRLNAYETLEDLGKSAKSALEQADLKNAERKIRVQELVKKIKIIEMFEETSISLKDKMPASTALEFFCGQTGCKFAQTYVSDEYLSHNVNLTPGSFWKTLDSILSQSNMWTESYGEELRLSSTYQINPKSFNGPFRAMLTSYRRVITEEQEYSNPIPTLEQKVIFGIAIDWEPKIKVISHDKIQLEITPDTGHRIISAPINSASIGLKTRISQTITIEPPSIKAATATVNLKFPVALLGDFTNLVVDLNATEEIQQDDVSVEVLPKTEKFRVYIRRTWPYQDSDLQSAEMKFEFISATDDIVPVMSKDVEVKDNGLIFRLGPPFNNTQELRKVKIYYPRLRAQKEIKFEFKDVKLPQEISKIK